MICSSCQKEIKDGSLYCPYCGNVVPKSSAEQPPVLPPAHPVVINDSLPIYRKAKKNKNKLNIASGIFIGLSILLAIISVVVFLRATDARKRADLYKSQADTFEKQSIDLAAQLVVAEDDIDYYKTLADQNLAQANDNLALADNYKNQLETAQSDLKEVIGDHFLVKVTDTYNGNGDGSNISDYLYADSLIYLFFDYEIFSTEDISNYYGKEVQINIYDPTGELMQGEESPTSCSFTDTIYSNVGGRGWGNADGGVYDPGLYVIQFVYDGEIVGTEAVIIN